jgi:DNA-binding MarR family transcriptional regulator
MYKDLDPLLHSQLRLAIISILISSDEADFVFLRKQTNASAGNVSVQIEKLRESGYIVVNKDFKGKVPCTTCRITPKGVDAFEKYVKTIQSYLLIKK